MSFSSMTPKVFMVSYLKNGKNLFNFLTLNMTISTQAKYDYKLLHDLHKLSGSENFSITRMSTKFAIIIGKMQKFTKMQPR